MTAARKESSITGMNGATSIPRPGHTVINGKSTRERALGS